MDPDLTDLEINIQRDRIYFRLRDNDFTDQHRLDDQLIAQLAELRSQGHADQYGSLLLRSTFVEEALRGYRQVQAAIDAGTFLRIRVNIDPEASRLHTLRWECLQDFEAPVRRLGCSKFTPLSRYLPLPNTRTRVREQTLRVLVAIASPKDLGEGRWRKFTPLNKEGEWMAIDRSLEYFGDRVQFELQTTPASVKAIRDRLEAEDFHVLHLIGHGGYRDDPNRPELGYMLLERHDDELAEPVTDERLGQLVMDLPSLQLVVLAACHSADRSDADAFIGMAPNMIRYGVPAVVAMQELVTFDTARRFAEGFYHSLGYESLGRVDVAINDARRGLFMVDQNADWEWSIPVLFMRGDGQLFEPADSQTPLETRPPVLAWRLQATEPPGTAQSNGEGEAEIIPLATPTRSLDQQIPEPRADIAPETDRLAVRLYDLMDRHRFSLDELEEVCFRIDVDFTFAAGRSYTYHVRSLVRYCEKNGKLEVLSKEVARRLVNAASLIDVG